MDEKDKHIKALNKKIIELEQQNSKLLNKISELHIKILKLQESIF